MGAWNGGSWLGCGDLPAMGAVFYVGAGWPQWKPQAPTFHLSEAVGYLCKPTKLLFSSTAKHNNLFM